MKKLLLILVSTAGFASADQYLINRSSFITGTSHTACIISTPTVSPIFLDKVNIGASTSGGHILIVNSTWTVNGPIISSTTLTLGNSQDFNNTKMSGICYNAATPTNGVTILYHR